MKLDADQENALVQAAEVALDLEARTGVPCDLGIEWDHDVATRVFVWLGKMTPEGWAHLRHLTEHTRGRLEATAPNPEVTP